MLIAYRPSWDTFLSFKIPLVFEISCAYPPDKGMLKVLVMLLFAAISNVVTLYTTCLPSTVIPEPETRPRLHKISGVIISCARVSKRVRRDVMLKIVHL